MYEKATSHFNRGHRRQFCVAMASAFCREGDWAVVRQQTEPELTEAIRKEHPDLLILDGCMIPLNPIAFVRQLRETSDLTVMALIHRQNSFLEKELTELGVLCRRFPENPTELRREILEDTIQKIETEKP